MRTRTKRSRSESQIDCDSGNGKRWKRTKSQNVDDALSDFENMPGSSKKDAICSPSSSSPSSNTSSSGALNRQLSTEATVGESADENRLLSPTSSNEGDAKSTSSLFSKCGKSSFRRYSKLIDRSNLTCRSLPPQLQTEKWGSPQKFWDVLCNKTKVYQKDADWTRYHPDLKREMRYILLEWLMEVSDDLSLERESFYLAVDYIDRFFSIHRDIHKSGIQLVGATALFLAAKNEEVEPPRLGVFVDYGDGAYSSDDMRKCEVIMLHDLEWQMNPITALHWLRIYIQLAGCEDINLDKFCPNSQKDRPLCEQHDSVLATPNFPRLEFLHLVKVLDLCILDYDSLAYDASMLAAAVFSYFFGPDEVIEEVTGYKIAKLVKACEFVKPYLIVCDKHRIVGEPIKIRHGIRDEEMHNIQSLHPDLSSLMEEAAKLKKQLMNGNYDKKVQRVATLLRVSDG
uniref:Cyclin N-terminal domain-containing protein n=1 Tax=Syphacia muris TaxID=451379 RepID=A0A0N5AMY8_9BILA